MPPSNMPSWTGLLRTAALWPDRRWATGWWVSILLATRELQGWLADSRPYDGLHKRGWLSAINDFVRSTGHLGPDLRAALGQELVDAAAAASSLKTDFGSITQASAMRTRLAARRAADKQALGDLSTRWAAADVLAAAWRDLLEACRTAAVSYETLAIRRDLFWQLVRAGGHDADQVSRHLAGVLGDTAFEAALARLWLGDIGESEIPRPLPVQAAGLTEQEQLALCQRLLARSPARGHYVVWIAFDHAGPGNGTPAEFRRERGVHLARKALAHAGAGDPDAAAETGTAALAVLQLTGSGRISTDLKRLDVSLRQWKAQQAVTVFRDRLATSTPARP